jgi:hypothetical protein
MKQERKAKVRKFAVNKYRTVPTMPEHEFVVAARALCALYPMSQIFENSYVLSRFWAWFSQIELEPHVRIPVPRFLTIRDP